jgi:hypothetical protein
MGTPEEILRLMQLAGKADYTYSYGASSTSDKWKVATWDRNWKSKTQPVNNNHE